VNADSQCHAKDFNDWRQQVNVVALMRRIDNAEIRKQDQYGDDTCKVEARHVEIYDRLFFMSAGGDDVQNVTVNNESKEVRTVYECSADDVREAGDK
jgi:hypothetical protein